MRELPMEYKIKLVKDLPEKLTGLVDPEVLSEVREKYEVSYYVAWRRLLAEVSQLRLVSRIEKKDANVDVSEYILGMGDLTGSWLYGSGSIGFLGSSRTTNQFFCKVFY